MKKLESYFGGRTAVIAGGSSGIGLALARLIARLGGNVALIARNGDRLKRARKELEAADAGGKFSASAVDITNYSQVNKVFKRAEAELGPIEFLINSAGSAYTDYFEKIPIAQFKKQMELNYLGSVHTARAAARLMMPRGRGHILNVSSIAGFLGAFGFSAYSASKFAVIGFSQALRAEMKPYGLRVSVLCPPDVDTPGLKKENERKPYETKVISGSAALMSAEDVALYTAKKMAAAKFMILPNLESRFIYRVSGIFPRLPDLVMDFQIRQARKQLENESRSI